MRELSFNTTGPCRPEMHYMLPPAARLPARDLKRFIDQELYWVLHAPRQTGKTSFLMAWMKELNESGRAVACYVSVERCQGLEAIETSMPAICSAIRQYAKDCGVAVPDNPIDGQDVGSILSSMMRDWAALCAPKPLVVLFDEVDTLSGQTLISFLRQLRGGFATRGVGKFPTSVALVGMRDLKDYLVSSKDGLSVNPGSPFNIKESSQSLRNFNADEVRELLLQHTRATGQPFTDESIDEIFRFSCGQPWLVNALAKECVLRITPEGKTITAGHVYEAKEALIKSRAVHIDALAERLKDPRVKSVIQPILAGDVDPELAEGEAFRMCLDLGLVALENGTPSIANPIYREVLIRTLNYGQQLAIPLPEYRWEKENGDLDLETLMREFQAFWREHGDLWEQKADYTEVFPHLLLMAFFQRVLTTAGRDAGGGAGAQRQPEGALPWMGGDNGGARITREAAAGRERMDMLIEWKGFRHIIEIKLVHPRHGRAATLQKGLQQIARYRDKVGEATQTLALFDRTPAGRQMPWEERLLREQHGDVTVWWM